MTVIWVMVLHLWFVDGTPVHGERWFHQNGQLVRFHSRDECEAAAALTLQLLQHKQLAAIAAGIGRLELTCHQPVGA